MDADVRDPQDRVGAARDQLLARAELGTLPPRAEAELLRLADLLPDEPVAGLARRVWDVRVDWLPGWVPSALIDPQPWTVRRP